MDTPTTKCDLLPFPRTKCFLMFSSDFRTSEWFFETIVCEFKKSEERESKRRITYPKIGIHVKASRRWYVHVGQIIVTFWYDFVFFLCVLFTCVLYVLKCGMLFCLIFEACLR